MKRLLEMIRNLIVIGIVLILSSCNEPINVDSNQTGSDSPVELILYDWEDDIPQAVLTRFTEETGVAVKYVAYESGRDVGINLYSKNADYDVVVVDNDTIPLLIDNNLLEQLNYKFIPNFKYISISFRDLVHDPQNKYSIPFNWGTTGIIYLGDHDFDAPNSWSDLWQYPDSIKIGIKRDMPYDNLAFTKKMMGESINECDPSVLEKVSDQFLSLQSKIVWIETDAESSIDELEAGRIDMLVGWADDVFEARDRGLDVMYVLPDEGTMLWGDSYVVPAQSRNKDAAMQFINYLLDPEVSAEILQYNNYASANDSIQNYLPAELINDPIIFPDNVSLYDSEIYLAVTNECNTLQLDMWDKIINAIE